MWSGHRATRVSATGRLIEQGEKQESGVELMTKKWIKGPSRPGSADISSTIAGRSVMWEVKIKRDKPSPKQLKEQQLERKAGGEYFFVKTAEDFLTFYDSLFEIRTQSTIFE